MEKPGLTAHKTAVEREKDKRQTKDEQTDGKNIHRKAAEQK